jgi:serine/threonine-protein phosphatase 2A regulatory subunit B''
VIVPDDFKALFKYLLESHPGLEFLQATPEFQERYADTVVMRIFFSLDSNDDSKISWRDFKNSNLLETFFQVSSENDINVVR